MPLNLKPVASSSDTSGMLLQLATPPEPIQGRLRALRLSLNTPVVALDDLPVGPARAAVAVHAGSGGSRPTLVVRSLRSGEAIFFACDEELAELHGPDLVVDAALSYAESLGFLFDEDPLAAGIDPREVLRQWTEFLDGVIPGFDAEALAAGYEDVVLEATEEISLDEVALERPPLRLTKFRLRAAGAPATPVAVPEGFAAGPWIRLLAAF